jgi:hypothetical protein
MFRFSAAAVAASLLMAGAAPQVWSQTASNGAEGGKTRAQVIAERDEWLRTHRWDNCLDDWVVKDEFKTPEVMCTRDEVRKERDEWLRTHRWDPGAEVWVPLKPQPRELSTLTREQVRKETIEFLRTHEWDDAISAWKEKPRLGPRKD